MDAKAAHVTDAEAADMRVTNDAHVSTSEAADMTAAKATTKTATATRKSVTTSRVGLRIVLFEMLWGGGEEIASIVADVNRWSRQCKRRTT